MDEDRKSVPEEVGQGSAGWVRVVGGVRPVVDMCLKPELMGIGFERKSGFERCATDLELCHLEEKPR